MGWTRLPEGIDWKMMLGAGCLGGIGFTMSLFIASLAFGSGALLDVAKLGVIAASVVSGVTGYTLLRIGAGRAEAVGARAAGGGSLPDPLG
jgi:NhaA family Na+:H+ antiporter